MGWFDDERERIRRRPAPPAPPTTPGGPTTPMPPGGTTTTASGGDWLNLPPVLAGWDATKWNDRSHQSIKYRVGRILARYPPTVEGLKQAIPELQAAFPGLTFDGKDSITIPGGGPVDVLQGASQGGTAWQWITSDDQGAGHTGNTGIPPVAPNTGVGGVGGSGGFGGAGTTNTGAGSGWTIPRGSEYQFRGVPGYTPGYGAAPSGSGAFGVGGFPAIPGVPGSPGTTSTAAPTQPMNWSQGWNPSGDPMTGQAGAGATTGTTGASPTTSSGAFGVGQLPNQPGAPGYTGDRAPGTSAGGYDRAPEFTPLGPFVAPPSPEATTWNYERYEPGPNTPEFVLPTGQQALEQDPGYQFRIQQGLGALEQSAAARGLLRTGGSLKDVQEFGQRAASQEYQNAVDRALATAGFNRDSSQFDRSLGLNANRQNNTFSLEGTRFGADQRQQRYTNQYGAANQGYAYANQQNLAGNDQALAGYQTDVSRELAQQGINLTAAQNAFLNGLNAQQQQFMQIYLTNGQSFDQAVRLLQLRLQYPS